ASTHVPRDRDNVEDSNAVLRHAAGAGERRNRDVAADRRAAQIQLPEVVYTARTITAIVRDQGVMNPNLRGGADAQAAGESAVRANVHDGRAKDACRAGCNIDSSAA